VKWSTRPCIYAVRGKNSIPAATNLPFRDHTALKENRDIQPLRIEGGYQIRICAL